MLKTTARRTWEGHLYRYWRTRSNTWELGPSPARTLQRIGFEAWCVQNMFISEENASCEVQSVFGKIVFVCINLRAFCGNGARFSKCAFVKIQTPQNKSSGKIILIDLQFWLPCSSTCASSIERGVVSCEKYALWNHWEEKGSVDQEPLESSSTARTLNVRMFFFQKMHG